MIRFIRYCEITQGMGGSQHEETEAIIGHVRTHEAPYFCDWKQVHPCAFKLCANFVEEERQEFI